MDLYSITLSASFVTLGIAVAAVVFAHLRRDLLAWRVVAKAGAALALMLVVFSGIIHLHAGHRPGSSTALNLAGFLAEHPALFVVATGALVIFCAARFMKS